MPDAGGALADKLLLKDAPRAGGTCHPLRCTLIAVGVLAAVLLIEDFCDHRGSFRQPAVAMAWRSMHRPIQSTHGLQAAEARLSRQPARARSVLSWSTSLQLPSSWQFLIPPAAVTPERVTSAAVAESWSRRDALRALGVLGAAAALKETAPAEAGRPGANLKAFRKTVIPETEYKDIPGTDLKYYDLVGGTEEGAAGAGPGKGQRVSVDFDLVVNGNHFRSADATGKPYRYTVGVSPGKPGGPNIRAFNDGLKGMQIGTVRRILVAKPPCMLDIELLNVRNPSPTP